MKHFIYTISILFCFSFTAVGQNKLRVLTYNIWDPSDISFWEKHNNGSPYPTDNVIEYLTEDNADVLLLQEVTLEAPPHNQTYQALREKLIKKGYKYTAFYMPSKSVGYVPNSKNSGYPLAIFSKFPVEETFSIQKSNGKVMSKGVLGIRININNIPIYVFNTHLSIGDHDTDDEISKVALPYVNNVSQQFNVIFAGDFNSPPATDFPNTSHTIGNYNYSSKTTQFILDSQFQDAWFELSNTQKRGGDATYPETDAYISRIDHVYYRGDNLKPTFAFTKYNLWKDMNLSDHKGVVVDFVLD